MDQLHVFGIQEISLAHSVTHTTIYEDVFPGSTLLLFYNSHRDRIITRRSGIPTSSRNMLKEADWFLHHAAADLEPKGYRLPPLWSGLVMLRMVIPSRG